MSGGPRIAIGGVLTECNHLGGLPIDLAVYQSSELYRGDEMLEVTTSVVGGMLDALRRAGAKPLPLLYASTCSSGPITRDCYDLLREDWLTRLRRALPVDGVLLPLHGAALVEGLDDPEGDLIGAARSLVGPDTPIVATLDLHAHVTRDMVRRADALLAWETYPHVDQYATGQRAVRMLLDTLDGRSRPTMAMGKVPVITSAIRGSTHGSDPFAEMMWYAKALEQRPQVLSTSLILIHPYMDCADMGSGGIVITDNDPVLAERLAADLALRYWDRRHDLEPQTLRPEEAIARAEGIPAGPIVLVECADCCGGGAAGDSIATLAALVDSGVKQPALAPLVDPAAAAACHRAGEGAQLTLRLGHQLDPRWGEPREFSGRVERLCAGDFSYGGGQWEGPAQMGPSAVFAVGSLQVLIMSRPTYDWADEQFRAAGLDPTAARFIVAKNPMNYRLAYGAIASALFVLDTPGPTPPTLKHVRFQNLRRPYFPADAEILDLQPTILK